MPTKPKTIFDTDESKEIRVWLLKMPEFVKRLESLYVIVAGNPEEKITGLVQEVADIKAILSVLLRLAWIVAGASITFLVGAGLAGLFFLVRYAPVLSKIGTEISP